MNIQKINDYLFMVDLKPSKIEKFIASYIIKGEKNAIIECGPTSTIETLLNGLNALEIPLIEIDYVMLSHIHLDHGGGAGELLKHLPKAKLIVHPRGIPHLANPQKLWAQAQQVLGKIAEIYGEPTPVPLERMIPAEDNVVLDLGDSIEIQMIETLGHAPHHLSYYEKKNGVLFPGDTAGIYIPDFDAILPTTPPLLVLDKILESIEKLIGIGPKTLCYTHFGPASHAVEKLKAYVSQLKVWASTVRECLKNNEGLEEMKRKLMERDYSLKKVVEHFKDHPIINDMFTRDIQGFIAYYQRYGLE